MDTGSGVTFMMTHHDGYRIVSLDTHNDYKHVLALSLEFVKKPPPVKDIRVLHLQV